MAENKTKPTDASVDEHLATMPDAQRADAQILLALLSKVTGEPPVMWGPTIVGFGQYHYRYESGREGDSALTGFAARKSELVVYLSVSEPEQQALLSRLGKHRMGKVCLYLRRLADIDMAVLEALVVASVADTRRRYPEPGGGSHG